MGGPGADGEDGPDGLAFQFKSLMSRLLSSVQRARRGCRGLDAHGGFCVRPILVVLMFFCGHLCRFHGSGRKAPPQR
jgi:hypothetical protein